ncbi:227 kDa spindle- and centromere-associated protein-like isoform X4 [Toxorhynchites rutilus septentrionalis]|uniref:227 kDa spindle- and centromere-associated protein-like isoform X4 n=1 Tax=Toxorhynchites rutilus septentrionalis TaxID=329112 RepID=UPI002479BC19|nr:227 kDa spindle- and centromere-associated protein-like isoform X4 [Toxorhynchites rutilus septentrionalis]
MENPTATRDAPPRPEESHVSCPERNGGDCTICGETRSLDTVLVEKVNELFENRLQYVRDNGNKDHAKIDVYEDWVTNLRMINLEMVEVIKKMETTFQNRIPLLSKNIRASLRRAEHDRNKLRDIVRKAYKTNRWDISGVQFHDASIHEIFGEGSASTHSENGNNDGQTIAVSLALSSNFDIENVQMEQLHRELEEKNRQIADLEFLLDQMISERSSEMEVEDAKLQNDAINNLRTGLSMLKAKLESRENLSQVDIDVDRYLNDLNSLESQNKISLQRLQNNSRAKSDQYKALLKENEALREQICTLKNQVGDQSSVDSQSLVNEVQDHYDKNRRLENKLRQYEQSLRKANAAVEHRDCVIEKLREDIKKGSLKETCANSTAPSSNAVQESHSSGSIGSFGSANSGSSVVSVIAAPVISSASVDGMRSSLDRLAKDSNAETEQIECLRSELNAMAEELERFHATKQAQNDIIVALTARLDAKESEIKVLRDEYENNNKMLFLIRTEIVKLIKAVRESLKGQLHLPQNLKPVEEFVSPPYSISGTDLPANVFEQDKMVIGSLKQHMEAITAGCLLANAEKSEINKMLDIRKKEISVLQKEKRRCEDLIEVFQKRDLSECTAEDKETSIDSDIMTMSSGEIASETLTQQRQLMQQTLRDVAKEISNLCKNRLVTISNLRTALEETKRSGSASIDHLSDVIQALHSEVAVLSEQLNYAFRENLAKESDLDNCRDANLQLRCQISHMSQDLDQLKEITALVDVRRELAEETKRYTALLRNEADYLRSQMAKIRSEVISTRQCNGDYLSLVREKCAEMEMEHQKELQRMRDEIESLSIQLVGSSEMSNQHEQLLRESNTLQNTILELSNQNEVLQKAIQSYEANIEQLQQELSSFNFECGNLNREIEILRASCSEKDNKITCLNSEREKLLADFNLHRRMCKCGFNNSVKERAKTPVSHSLQKQLVQKSLEATKAADALRQKSLDFKKLENQYVAERIRLTEQTTELFTQIGELKGKNSNLEQSLFHKEELIERLQQSLRDVNRSLADKSEIAKTTEVKNASLSKMLEKFQEDSTVREKKLAEELNNTRRSSQDQRNKLQQTENQLALLREEIETLRGKCESLLTEKNTLKDETTELNRQLFGSIGKESALCEMLKQLQEDLSSKTSCLGEVEENYRKVSQAYRNLKSYNEDVTKQYQMAKRYLMDYNKLADFKRQATTTIEEARKCAVESRQRERIYEQKVAEQTAFIVQLKEDRVRLIEKLQDYHRDLLILNQKLDQQAYDDRRRNTSTSLHQTFYPSEAYKLVRSSSDPNCKDSDELFRRTQYTRERIHRTREFWRQGIKDILPRK